MCKKYTKYILYLALFGIVLSIYSFLHNAGTTNGSFCNLNSTFNCDVVNKGPYGNIAGFPVSAIGIIGYGLLALTAGMKLKHPKDRGLSQFLLIGSLLGFLFSLYLTSIEMFVLHTYCLICLTSQAIMLSIFIFSCMHECKCEHKKAKTSID